MEGGSELGDAGGPAFEYRVAVAEQPRFTRRRSTNLDAAMESEGVDANQLVDQWQQVQELIELALDDLETPR